eukprot:tig00000144_g9001.t1
MDETGPAQASAVKPAPSQPAPPPPQQQQQQPAHGKRPSKQVREKQEKVGDALQRMSYLYQAAFHTMPHNPALARFYAATMRKIGTKALIRLDASIKLTVCKRCNSPLVAGASSTVRVHPRSETVLVVTCNECRSHKRCIVRRKPPKALEEGP